MGVRVGVLTPTAESGMERTQSHGELSRENIALMQTLSDNSSSEKWHEWEVISTASLIYSDLIMPPYYKTWDELRSSLKKFECLDEAIRLLKDRGIIRDGLVEKPQSGSETV